MHEWPPAKFDVPTVTADFQLDFGWDKAENPATLRIAEISLWLGLGLREGLSVRAAGGLRDTRKEGMVSATLVIGMGDPDFGGRIYNLRSQVRWTASLRPGVDLPVQNRLQAPGGVMLRSDIVFTFARATGWEDQNGDDIRPTVSPLAIPSHTTEPSEQWVSFERGWSLHYPGFFLQGFRGTTN